MSWRRLTHRGEVRLAVLLLLVTVAVCIVYAVAFWGQVFGQQQP